MANSQKEKKRKKKKKKKKKKEKIPENVTGIQKFQIHYFT